MTMADFRSLDDEDQYITWLTRSVQVSDWDTTEHYYVLYQLDSFYIEMKFFKWNDEEPVMRTFSKDRRLRPYLYKININGIFSNTW